MMPGWAHADELAQPVSFEEKLFFDPDFGTLQMTDSRTYTSSPRKRERLQDSKNRLRMNRDYFMGIFSDIAYTATSPLSWDDSDWMKAAWVAGGTGLFFILDEEIRDGLKIIAAPPQMMCLNFLKILEMEPLAFPR